MQIQSKKIQKTDMTEGVIWKQLLLFFLPIIFGSFFQQLYNTADAVIVGNFVGKEALAAVGGATGTFISLLIGFFTGLASGATVMIAQYYGANQQSALQKTIHTGVALGLAGGVVLMAVGLFLAPIVLSAMGTPADIMQDAVTYMRIYFAGVIPNLLYNIGAGILRALGDSRRPLIVLIVCCFCNIGLDVLFVLGLHMGVAGAGIATILSQLISCICILLFLARMQEEQCRLYPARIRFDLLYLKKIVQIGLPAGLQSSMYSISNVIIQSTINTFGTDTVAAWTVYGKIDCVYWMTISAFGIAITTFVGQNFGARKFDRIKRGVRVCMGMSVLATAVISIASVVFGETVLRLFNDDPGVIAVGMRIIRTVPPLFITYNAIEILCGALRGTGDAVRPMLMTMIGVCVLRLVWIFTVVPLRHTIETVVLSYPITWTVTSAAFFIYYIHGGWLKRRCAAAGISQEQISA
ncbi:MAG: MATE family efflux transporter [Clostridia bacterium]|nr:MATE family efflux transporter [Clostridia bacterium]